MQRTDDLTAHLTIEVSANALKDNRVAFGAGVTAATVAVWIFSGHSTEKAIVLLLAMLFGGSMYFLLRARG